MQLLVIKISQQGGKPECALLGKKQSQDRFTPGDWKSINSLTRGRRVLLLIPNKEVVLTSINIPSKNKKQLLQAVPFALEDTLAEDIEDLHFAVHQDKADDTSQVAIINRSVLGKHLVNARSHGIAVHFVLPEILTQKNHTKGWSLIYNNNNEEETVNVRLSDYDGFSCNGSMLEMFVSEQLEKRKPEFIYSNIEKQHLPPSLQDVPSEIIDSGLIHYKSIRNALPLNLVTNFVATSNAPTINWKAWRPVAILGGLLASVWISIFIWQNSFLQKQSDQLSQQMVQLFKTSFPEKTRVDGGVAATRMKIELDILKKNTGKTIDSPLPLLSTVSPLLKQYKDMTLKEVRYQENELSLIMQSPSLTRLETFKKDAAEKNKLKVDIKSSTTTSNKVEATLIISPLTSSTAKESFLGIDSQENT